MRRGAVQATRAERRAGEARMRAASRRLPGRTDTAAGGNK